jgi:hypothetical protein
MLTRLAALDASRQAGIAGSVVTAAFLLLHLIGDVVAELLSDLLFGLGIEVG